MFRNTRKRNEIKVNYFSLLLQHRRIVEQPHTQPPPPLEEKLSLQIPKQRRSPVTMSSALDDSNFHLTNNESLNAFVLRMNCSAHKADDEDDYNGRSTWTHLLCRFAYSCWPPLPPQHHHALALAAEHVAEWMNGKRYRHTNERNSLENPCNQINPTNK